MCVSLFMLWKPVGSVVTVTVVLPSPAPSTIVYITNYNIL